MLVAVKRITKQQDHSIGSTVVRQMCDKLHDRSFVPNEKRRLDAYAELPCQK